MVYELVSLELVRPTDERCAASFSFGLHPRMSPAIDDILFSGREDEENIDLSLITSRGGCHSSSRR